MGGDNPRGRERFEKALRDSTTRLNAAQRIARIGDFIWNVETDELTWSDSLYDLLKYDRAEGIDTDTFDNRVVHPDDRERVERWLREAIASGRRRAASNEYRLLRKDSEVMPVRAEAVVERNAEGSPRVFGTVQDITKQKEAEQALKESEERFRLAFDQQFQFMGILSPDGLVLEVNERPLRVQGVSRADYVGKPFWLSPAWRDLPEWQELIRSRLEEAKTMHGPLLTEDVYQTSDGEIRHADAAYTAIRGQEGSLRFILVQATDTTDRRHAEEQVRKRERQLRALTERLRSVREEQSARIARELHDELGQALTALKFDLAWLADRAPTTEMLEKTESMKAFIDSTLNDVRRIATELRPRVLDDAGLIEALEWQIREFEQYTGIPCEFGPVDPAIKPDSERSTAIFRIFQELLTNVARHAEASRVSATLRQRDGALELVVADDGKGITDEALDRSGSLGLVGMRERALGFDGEIHVESLPEKGTTVTLRIPAPCSEKPTAVLEITPDSS